MGAHCSSRRGFWGGNIARNIKINLWVQSKVSFLFCSAPDGAFRVQTAAAARACVRNLKPRVPTVPVEGDFVVAIFLGTSKSICGCKTILLKFFASMAP